ncbi:MAG: SDR family NAD(P)-dependent oxidoreductase [Bacteroidetes bacterium]|nr:MAG: SDR family NAD(P)-dependent oxidoreductase [Bacteroidota bacterium]
MKKAIIIGASTGIGRETAIQLAQQGYEIGICARRKELLEQLQSEIQGTCHIMSMDISETEEAREKLASLINSMGGVDMIILNAGIGIPNADWKGEEKIININVTGFASLANFSFEYFRTIGKGCIAGVSSIAGLRGGSISTAYCASKAFVSNYMEGLRCKAAKENLDITVTDIIPGFVDTPMTEKQTRTFWSASAKKAAGQLISAVVSGKSKGYVTKRWVLVATIMKVMPLWLLSKI